MKKEIITEVTPEIIAKWRAEYGAIRCVEVAEDKMSLDPYMLTSEIDDVPRVKGYIHLPDNKVLNAAMQRLPNMMEAGKVIIKNCWLGGDERMIKEDTFFNSAALQVIELIQIHQGRLKEV